VTLESAVAPSVTIDGRQVLLFSSNDYLGLACHPALVAAGQAALAEFGAGAASSRLICGTLSPHRQLEEGLREWLHVEAVLLFSSGFTANQALLATLPGPQDVILSDELNHASIVQGCRLSRAQVLIYRHCDVEHLTKLLQGTPGARRRFIVTDAIFSVDGDAAPLAALSQLAEVHDAALMVDEAHSLGVTGPQGRGLCADLALRPDIFVATLGKSFGVSGAFVAGSTELIRLLESRAAPYIFTTASPPVVAAMAAAALPLVASADEARANLLANAQRLRQGLTQLGCRLCPGDWHIVPALVPGIAEALALQRRLYEKGLWVPALRPPTVPAGTERLRWSASASHSREQIDRALAIFADAYGQGRRVSGRNGT
jgi:8-amino-7-oxononanoate synthase